MHETITVGVDGSPESMDAVDWAAREALLRGMPLTLLHAGYESAAATHLPEIDVPAQRQNQALDIAVREVTSRHPGLEVVPLLIHGPPSDSLLMAARSAQMLVLGSRGFSGFAGFMLGSVALDVTARATCPIVLVRAGEHAQDEHLRTVLGTPSSRTPYRPVVLGLDIANAGDELLAFAFDAAIARDAPLQVIHAWKVPPLYSYGQAYDPRPTPDIDVRAATQEALTAALRPWTEKYPGTHTRVHLLEGGAAHHLRAAADGASLLVVGRRDTAGYRLGPVTHSAIHHVECPVAAVPHGAQLGGATPAVEQEPQ
ncbi:universal stress protein [Streptomyces sp. NPDC006208]|uniref:universal stress protein n=1 Tax=Streptomyces sp. NPDC006208 TaxID=3156734 RepID=UPI0033A72BF6